MDSGIETEFFAQINVNIYTINQAPFIYVKTYKIFFCRLLWIRYWQEPFCNLCDLWSLGWKSKILIYSLRSGRNFSKSTSTPFCFEVWKVLFNTMIKNFLGKWCLLFILVFPWKISIQVFQVPTISSHISIKLTS